MLAVDISGISVDYLKIKKSIRGGYKISQVGRLPMPSAGTWKDVVGKLPKEDEIVISLPSSHVFLHRLEVDNSLPDEARNHALFEKICSLIPYEENELVLSHYPLYVNPQNNMLVVLFCASPRKNVLGVTSAFTALKYTVKIVIPNAFSAHEIISQFIPSQEVVLYFEIGRTHLTSIFFDAFGPYITLSFDKTANLASIIRSSVNFFKTKYLYTVSKVLIAGEESAQVDIQRLMNEVGMPVLLTTPLVAQKLKSANLSLPVSQEELVYYLNALGVGFAALREAHVNLLVSAPQEEGPLANTEKQPVPPGKSNTTRQLLIIFATVAIAALLIVGFLFFIRQN